MADPRFLLDTNICIYMLAGLSDPTARRLSDCVPGEVVTSAICYCEIMRGIDQNDADQMAAVRKFFTTIPVAPFGLEAALAYNQMPFQRHRFDRLIAAHAMALKVALVTNNEKDFGGIPGLRVENWTV